MSVNKPPAPTITNAGTKPTTPRELFVNIPVEDLQRSITFFEALGFVFNPQFTDGSAAAMLVGKDSYFMLLTRDRFAGFSNRPLPDPRETTGALFALSADSRTAVDAMVHKAIAAGGSDGEAAQDHGSMYQWSFRDPDGYHWEAFWMDPAAING